MAKWTPANQQSSKDHAGTPTPLTNSMQYIYVITQIWAAYERGSGVVKIRSREVRTSVNELR
jgi:hypothetical protein